MKLTNINPNLLKSRLYYSQNREDLILDALLSSVGKGFYVDVGAYDPDLDSVTKLFYLKGWSGINIEPQPNRIKYFIKRRERDINLNLGVSDKKGSLMLRSYYNQGLSTFDGDMKTSYEQEASEHTATYEDIRVQVTTLEDIFASRKISKIDFMKVDVEGLEYEVLKGNDWKKYRPAVICIEANHISKDWRELLAQAKYENVFFDGLNEYYADAFTNIKKNFDYIQYVIIERGGGLRWDDFSIINSLHKEHRQMTRMLIDADKELRRKDEIINTVNAKLINQESIKKTFSRFVMLLSRRLKRIGQR